MDYNCTEQLARIEGLSLTEQDPLRRHTTLKVGGPAALRLVCNTLGSLRQAIETLQDHGIPWVLMGRGSCIIVADEGYRGAVVQLGREFRRIHVSDRQVMHVGAATGVQMVVQEAFARGLSGLEGLAGIPGTVGGAVSTNAGMGRSRAASSAEDAAGLLASAAQKLYPAQGQRCIGDLVEEVLVFRPGTGLVSYTASELQWAERFSSIPANEVIVEAALRLTVDDVDRQRRDIEAVMKLRSSCQPLRLASCDAIFADVPTAAGALTPAGSLLADCRMAGKTWSKVQAYPRDPNYLVNLGGARARQVTGAIYEMMEAVRRIHGIELRPQVKFLGFTP